MSLETAFFPLKGELAVEASYDQHTKRTKSPENIKLEKVLKDNTGNLFSQKQRGFFFFSES